MEVKSRYEIISDLEKQKRDLIRERDSFQFKIEDKENEILIHERNLEDLMKSLTKFKDSIEDRKATIKELIASIDTSLERLGKMQEKK